MTNHIDLSQVTASDILHIIGVATTEEVPASLRLTFGRILWFLSDSEVPELPESGRELAWVVLEKLGLTPGLSIPWRVRKAIGGACGLEEKPVPAWVKVGAMIWCPYLSACGKHMRVDRIDPDGGIWFDGDTTRKAPGAFGECYWPERDMPIGMLEHVPGDIGKRTAMSLREMISRLDRPYCGLSAQTRAACAKALSSFVATI